jgi:hypothetical protein
MGADNGAIDAVQLSIQLTSGVGLRRECPQEALEDASLTPPLEATGHGATWAITLGQIPPRRSSAQDPPHAVTQKATVDRRESSLRFLRWEHRVKALLSSIGQLFSVHSRGEYTHENQICKHAPVLLWSILCEPSSMKRSVVIHHRTAWRSSQHASSRGKLCDRPPDTLTRPRCSMGWATKRARMSLG